MNRAIPDLPPGMWSVLRARAPDADQFVSLLRAHRLLSIAANDPSLDAGHARAAWERDRAADDARSAAIDVELGELTALLDPADVIFIKGAVFRRTIYPDRTLRSMSDIDVVVRVEKADAIRHLFVDNGYAAVAGGHDYYVKAPRNLPVEIIPRFTQRTRHAIDYDEIFRARTPDLAEHHALATHALLIGTTLHVYARKYLDLWLLSRDPDVLDRAIETAVRWRMRRVFYAAMCLLARAFPGTDVQSRRARSGRTLTISERRLVERIIPRDVLGPDAWHPLLRAKRLALLDSTAIRARFVTSVIRREAT